MIEIVNMYIKVMSLHKLAFIHSINTENITFLIKLFEIYYFIYKNTSCIQCANLAELIENQTQLYLNYRDNIDTDMIQVYDFTKNLNNII